MSTSAWIMFLIGAGIIWGGLVISLAVAIRKTRRQNRSAN